MAAGRTKERAPERCERCKRIADSESAWCNFCGYAATWPHRCTTRDLGALEAALSSQDPAVVCRALTNAVVSSRGAKPLLPAHCRLVIERHTLTTTAGSPVVDATVLGSAHRRWRLQLQREDGGWKMGKMAEVPSIQRVPGAA